MLRLSTRAWAFILLLCIWRPVSAEEPIEKRPNILWLVPEDTSPWMPAWGDTSVATPNLDRLAETGVVLLQAHATNPICSPSRSSLMTGRNPTSDGVSNHRMSRDELQRDWVRLPQGHKTLPEIFRANGYDTFNIGKDDYNFVYDRKVLYSQGPDGKRGHLGQLVGPAFDWATLGREKPFFGQIQLAGGKSKEVLLDPFDPAKVKLPAYYPDTPAFRREYATHYDTIRILDREVGEIMRRLAEAGLAENTIVFVLADHGMVSLRHKQFVYDGGTHVPVFIGSPQAWRGVLERYGKRRDDLVSLIDLSATSLDLAGLTVPDYFEGQSVVSPLYNPRSFVVSSRDRADFTFDRIRSVRSDKFRYIRNYFPKVPYMQPQYRSNWPAAKEWREQAEKGALTPAQAAFLAATRPPEEIYDLEADPDQVINLATDPRYSAVKQLHSAILDQWLAETGDLGLIEDTDQVIGAVIAQWGDECVDPRCVAYRERYGRGREKPSGEQQE